jgi:hypothetical protein
MPIRALTFALALTAAVLAPQPQAQQPKQPKESPGTVHIAVSPTGSDAGDGSPSRPFLTLPRAQRAVRDAIQNHDVSVDLADGLYRLSAPLRFTSADGGRNGHRVTWTTAAGAHPVLSGAIAVTGWRILDPHSGIYVADTPVGLDARQLWANDHLLPRAALDIPRADVTFTPQGLTLKTLQLPAIPDPARVELESTGFFTDRFSPVAAISGQTVRMQQPAWNNNLWGYDTIPNPYHPELSHLRLLNALAFLTQPGQWFLDPAHGKLYLRPPVGASIANLHVELPTHAVLLSLAGTVDAPIHDLTFRGLRFSHTTWLGPASPQGYASQQSGAFLTGHAAAFPADPLITCRFGCPAFETVRNDWNQTPAAIQVAAAARITFDQDIFAHLGQYALGIGNDADANLSGIGLATSDITVSRSVFTDDAGGAIQSGGVRRDAHHPPDPRQINQSLIVVNNRISNVSLDFRDNTAILSTYVLGAIILHNDISDVPYDAIDIGFGWGIEDPGGNPNYRTRMHGYDDPANLVYQTPTPHRDVVVASNRIHRAKQFFRDGGAIYNLSAAPGTLITENYIFDNSGQIGIYLDEGSRYITVRRNVVDDPHGEWLNINTVHAALPLRISTDNTAIDNWHNSAKVGGLWTNYENDLILDDHLIGGDQWPPEAGSIMRNAGVEPSAGLVVDDEAKP